MLTKRPKWAASPIRLAALMARMLPLLTALATCVTTALAAPAAQAAPSAKAFALNGTDLVSFNPAAPGGATSVPIAGLTAGETLVGIDVRPANGMLYGLGVNAAADTATLYVIGPTGFASAIGTPSAIALTTNGINAVDLPAGDYGFDVNPVADRIRVTSSTSLNFRINPNNGAALDGSGATGVNPDGPINGVTTGVGGAAFTNSGSNLATATTLYTLDAASDALMIQNPSNNGTQTSPLTLTLSGVPLNVTAVPGFDVDPAVAVATNNVAATGDGYAILTVGGVSHLYTIDLATGAATDRGAVGDGSGTFRGLALQREALDGDYPAIGLVAGGTTLHRFMARTPAGGVDLTVTGLQPGEILVGIAWRPATGQLLGLGADTTANTGTLYLIDPSSGGATAISAPGSVQWTSADGATPVDLPSATAGWSIDVNPTVDRVRVVASGGLNARINPNNGAAIDGDLGQASPITGTNPDGLHHGAATSVMATAYTNAYAQPLTGGVTTQYTLDAATNQLLIQNPSNAGTLLAGRPLMPYCAPVLDFGPVGDLDLPADVAVTTAGTAAAGEAIAALTVGGTPGVYAVNLQSGIAFMLGTPPAALVGLAVGNGDRSSPSVRPIPGCLAPPGPPKPKDPPGTPPPVVTPDRTAPRVTKLTVTTRSKKRLTIAFTTSEAGKVTIQLQRKVSGRRTTKKRCVAGRKTGTRCTLYKAYKTVTKTITKPGEVTIATTGRTGAVRVLVTVRDKAGNTSKAVTKSAASASGAILEGRPHRRGRPDESSRRTRSDDGAPRKEVHHHGPGHPGARLAARPDRVHRGPARTAVDQLPPLPRAQPDRRRDARRPGRARAPVRLPPVGGDMGGGRRPLAAQLPEDALTCVAVTVPLDAVLPWTTTVSPGWTCVAAVSALRVTVESDVVLTLTVVPSEVVT